MNDDLIDIKINFEKLSKENKEVIYFIACGYSLSQISNKTNISINKIYNIINNFRKTIGENR